MFEEEALISSFVALGLVVGVAAIDECLSGSGLRKGLGMESLIWVVGDSGSAIETAEVEAIGVVCGTKMRGICCKCWGGFERLVRNI